MSKDRIECRALMNEITELVDVEDLALLLKYKLCYPSLCMELRGLYMKINIYKRYNYYLLNKKRKEIEIIIFSTILPVLIK